MKNNNPENSFKVVIVIIGIFLVLFGTFICITTFNGADDLPKVYNIVLGLAFIIAGVSGPLIMKISGNAEKTLKENGKLIYANYVKTIFCENNTVNDKHPYYIVCEWNNPQDGKKYMLKSKNIWWNPEDIIYRKSIQTFPVYMDPNNSRKYIMDLDILKED